MREALVAGYLKRKLAFMEAMEGFFTEEKGASDIVAILLVIVILIAVAGVFRTQLMGAVTGVFESLMEALGL